MGFFENELYASFIVGAFFLTLFLLEFKFPLRKRRQKVLPRLTVNFFLAGLTFIIAMALVRPVSMQALAWTESSSLGILNYLDVPFWPKVLLGFLFLDLSFYYWHWLNHNWPFLWRFHNIHHIDLDLDVSTGFRFHFGEVALSSIFRAVQVIIIGPTILIFLAYEFVFRLATFFHHSDLRLPKKADDLIKLVLVTPRMHGIHHSNYRSETDSNYSVVFSFWDRIHRTFSQNIPQRDITTGVPGYSKKEDNRIGALLFVPFKKQRDYWQGRIQRRTDKENI